jgi:hypothetical protein
MLLKADKGLHSREIQGVSFIVYVITATLSYRKPGSFETVRDSCQVLGYDKRKEV